MAKRNRLRVEYARLMEVKPPTAEPVTQLDKMLAAAHNVALGIFHGARTTVASYPNSDPLVKKTMKNFKRAGNYFVVFMEHAVPLTKSSESSHPLLQGLEIAVDMHECEENMHAHDQESRIVRLPPPDVVRRTLEAVEFMIQTAKALMKDSKYVDIAISIDNMATSTRSAFKMLMKLAGEKKRE